MSCSCTGCSPTALRVGSDRAIAGREALQNPLTTLPETVASAERVLGRQDGPVVLVGHSFSGMIVT